MSFFYFLPHITKALLGLVIIFVEDVIFDHYSLKFSEVNKDIAS